MDNEIKRDTNTLIYPYEIKFLMWIVRRYPAWMTPDTLTFSSVIFAFLCGLFYYLTKYSPLFVLGASLFLILNWIADGTDGNLARYRHIEKERYGYYLDHICDMISIFFIFFGLGLSEYMTMGISLTILSVIYLMAINTYLSSYSNGIMILHYERFGGSEIKLLTVGLNFLIFFGREDIHFFGIGIKLFNLIGLILIIILIRLFAVSVYNNREFLKDIDKK